MLTWSRAPNWPQTILSDAAVCDLFTRPQKPARLRNQQGR